MPENAASFDAGMAERTAAYAPTIAAAYDFSDVRTVVDVGGGNGTLLVEILRRHAHLQGVLFETPTVAARADAVLDTGELADRCQVLAGDFFEQVLPGADCSVLANVLHDWEDGRATRILRNCRRSMARGGRVLIVERLIPEDGGDPVPTLLSDINMLVLIGGGQERTNTDRRPGRGAHAARRQHDCRVVYASHAVPDEVLCYAADGAVRLEILHVCFAAKCHTTVSEPYLYLRAALIDAAAKCARALGSSSSQAGRSVLVKVASNMAIE